MQGATAGVTRKGGQSVFKSSTPPKAAKAVPAPRPAASGATGDLWSGVQSAGTPSIASAASAGGQGDGGLGGGVVAGLVILGIGLTGLAGGLLVAGSRRRRASSSGANKR